VKNIRKVSSVILAKPLVVATRAQRFLVIVSKKNGVVSFRHDAQKTVLQREYRLLLLLLLLKPVLKCHQNRLRQNLVKNIKKVSAVILAKPLVVATRSQRFLVIVSKKNGVVSFRHNA
jgi:predicted transcriptional regulator